MTEWTSEAEKERDQFLSRQRHALSGADVNIEEVIDDIRRHFDEELKGLSVVTRADVQRTIRCFEPPPPLFPCEGPTKPTRLPDQNRPGIPLTLFGVVLPLISILVELTIHFCAGVFFDPIPSWWHVALVTFVPLGNALQIRRLRLAGGASAGLALGFNAAALVIAAFYATLYVPLLLPGLLATLYFGIGLLPFGPLFALIATYLLRQRLKTHLTISSAAQLKATLAGTTFAISPSERSSFSRPSRALPWSGPMTSALGVNNAAFKSFAPWATRKPCCEPAMNGLVGSPTWPPSSFLGTTRYNNWRPEPFTSGSPERRSTPSPLLASTRGTVVGRLLKSSVGNRTMLKEATPSRGAFEDSLLKIRGSTLESTVR